MDWTSSGSASYAPASKKRIPKACGPCRQSKVKCDGQKPCTRCRQLLKPCIFPQRPLDANEAKVVHLQNEIVTLRKTIEIQSQAAGNQSRSMQDNLARGRSPNHPAGEYSQHGQTVDHQLDTRRDQSPSLTSENRSVSEIGHELNPRINFAHAQQQNLPALFSSPRSALQFQNENCDRNGDREDIAGSRPKKSQFEFEFWSAPDFIAKGLITFSAAERFFDAFFTGCDRYVPVFDPAIDTLDSIRSRSPLLFNAICTVGCGMLSDSESQLCHLLNFQLKKMLNLVIVTAEARSLETVQALLVTACYVSERSLLLAFATRMALDLNLQDAYAELVRLLVTRDQQLDGAGGNKEADLMRQSRVWFQLLIFNAILRVDAGNLQSLKFQGDVRRCRILLGKHFTTTLDLRLLSQVELNFLRARVHDLLSVPGTAGEEDIMDLVRDAVVNIDVWFEDWFRIMNSQPLSNPETPSLLVNLEVQRYWSHSMVLCRAVRAIGNDDISSMTQTQRSILLMAKDALKHHLRTILGQPASYLGNFRYAMDFVWAKCAFCFLLLLKLTSFMPEEDEISKHKLLADGYVLLHELNKSVGGTTSGGQSSTSRLSLQVLQMGIEKYGRALQDDQPLQVQDPHSPVTFFWMTSKNKGQLELESFIPEQFVFEWDFPGLTFFSSPTYGAENFNEFFAAGPGGSDSLFSGIWPR